MRRVMRSILIGLLVTTLTVSPATACHYCGSYGGGYYTGNYYASSYCGGYDDSCCGGEVVVSDCCGGCSDCGCEGCGCDDCGGCANCGPSGEVMHGEMMQEHAPADNQPLMTAPEPPVMGPNQMGPEQSTVNRPATEPVPMLPPEPMHGTTDTEMPSTAPADRYEPSRTTTTPAADAEPTTPPADLFGPPPTVEKPPAVEKPLPVEEPATPAETDDFFSTPATEPGAEPASAPLDNDLFGPPSEAKPVEEATPPADEKKTEDDDLFGKAQTILEMPGGLASHSLRRWVDNTGEFSVRGRLVRVLDGKVQLLKNNGRTTTVPLARLSQADFQFVNRQASAQRAEAISKTAQVSQTWSN